MARDHDAAVTCTGIVKIYWSATGEVHALKGIDAHFAPGLVTAVVGPSGSGKSSLLRILAGVDRPTAGQVRLGEVELSALGTRRRRLVRRRHVGYVFQQPADNLLPYLSAREHVALGARLRGGPVERDEADRLFDALGLSHRAEHPAGRLSGGEQQRLAFAAAVAGSPSVVVADEPTAELDSGSAEALMDAVAHVRQRGIAFVISTHDPIVMEAADRVISLRHGSIEAESTAAGALAVIDAFGRIQLPEAALELFPDRRAVINVDGPEVRITPP